MTLDFELHLRETQQLTHVGSWEWDIPGDRLTWSDEHFRIFGFAPGSFTPTFQRALERVHPADVRVYEDTISKARSTHTAFEFTHRLIRNDGAVRTVVSRGAWVERAGLVRMYGTVQDITERTVTEDALVAADGRVQTLAGRILEVQEAERRLIARELHDEVGQALTAVQIGLQRLQRRRTSTASVGAIVHCTEIVARALEQVRGLALNLRPAHLDDLGLESAIDWLLDQQLDATGLRRRFDVGSVPRRLPPQVEIACFRVAQEALTNVVRHAQATEVAVALRCDSDGLALTIEDDGSGFDIPGARARALEGASMGLLGMEERASLAGGVLTIRSRDPRGTSVAAFFPLRDPLQTQAPEST